MKRIALPILLASMLVPAVAHAESPPQTSASALPERISFLVRFGEEACPEASDPDEIVVCATAPEGDRYRIPKDLRVDEQEAATAQSWSSAVATLDESARPMRPNSCSVVGTGGFTGCTQALLREWFAARRGKINAE